MAISSRLSVLVRIGRRRACQFRLVILVSLVVLLGDSVQADTMKMSTPALPDDVDGLILHGPAGNVAPPIVLRQDGTLDVTIERSVQFGGLQFLGAMLNPGQWDLKTTFNANAIDTINVGVLQVGGPSGLDLDGTGITVGVWDGGAVRDTHQEFNSGGPSRVTIIDAVGLSNHATLVTGTIAAEGDSPSRKGMATNVQIRSRDFNSDIAEMTTDFAGNLVDISNHSYGNVRGWTTQINWGIGLVDTWFADRFVNHVEDPGFGKYSTIARDLDEVLFDNPQILSVWAAGNERSDVFTNASGGNNYVTFFSGDPGDIVYTGPGWYLVSNGGTTSAPLGDGNAGTGFDSLGDEKTAKNGLVVGAADDHLVDPHDGATVSLVSLSSFGNVDDGRRGIDVIGNGASLSSTASGSDTSYGVAGGTSMSAANVTGAAALLIEHHRNVKGVTPRSATLKALLMHTATDVTNSFGTVGPDYSTGYGLVNADAAATFITDSANAASYLLEGNYNGTEHIYEIEATGTDPIKATLAWTDPEFTSLTGSTDLDNSTLTLINDLDIWFTDDMSTTFYPWTLDRLFPTLPALQTTANRVDNDEQVLIDALSLTPGGIYTLHLGGTLDGAFPAQEFSLLISGGMLIPAPSTLAIVLLGALALTRRRKSIK